MSMSKAFLMYSKAWEMRGLISFLLSLYRKFHFFRKCCRFYPSCSYYAEEAIAKHGLIFGVFLALNRLIRCNQWFPGGYDPVPQIFQFGDVSRETLVEGDHALLG